VEQLVEMGFLKNLLHRIWLFFIEIQHFASSDLLEKMFIYSLKNFKQ